MSKSAEYLRERGWKEIGRTAWRWADPKFKGTYYREADAVEIQQNRDRKK